MADQAKIRVSNKWYDLLDKYTKQEVEQEITNAIVGYTQNAVNETITGAWTFSGATNFNGNSTHGNNISAFFGSTLDISIYSTGAAGSIIFDNGDAYIQQNDGTKRLFIRHSDGVGTRNRILSTSADMSLYAAASLLKIKLADPISTTYGDWQFGTSGSKLGLWGATPVVQPASTGETIGFTAGTGASVNNDSTFTGGIGTTAYNLNDVVKALKQSGLLAQ